MTVKPTQNTLTNAIFALNVANNDLIKIGATYTNTNYTYITEGIRITQPSNGTHYVTRVVPRFEVSPYEDETTYVANIYSTAYDGSAMICGSENEIGDSTSSNLAIVGFNNNLTGDKMLVVGQGNDVDGEKAGHVNTASLVVGTTNSIQKDATNDGTLINTILSGQNNNITHLLRRSIVSGINNNIDIDSSNIAMFGANNTVGGSNNFVAGQGNELEHVNTGFVFGFANDVIKTGITGSSNIYGTLVAGWNNSLEGATFGSAMTIFGRDNNINPAHDSGIVAGEQNTTGAPTGGNNGGIFTGFQNRYGDNVNAGNTVTLDHTIASPFKSFVNMEYSLVTGYQHGEDQSGGGVVDVRFIGGSRNIVGGYKHTGSANMFIYDSLLVGNQHTVLGNQNSSDSAVTNARNIISGFNNDVGDTNTSSFSINNIIGGYSGTIYRASGNLIVGGSNKVGTTGTTYASSDNNIVGGSVNDVLQGADDNLVVGNNNDVYSTSEHNIIGGYNNNIGVSGNSSAYEQNSLIIGSTNTTASTTSGGRINKNNILAGNNNSFLTSGQSISNILSGQNSGMFGRYSIAVGGSNYIYTTGTGASFAFGSQNTLGTSSSPTSRAGALGYFVRLYKHESVGMGRFLQINDGETAGSSGTSTTSNNVVVVGQMNDYSNQNYAHSQNIPSVFIVGAGNGNNNTGRRNAIMVTKKGTVYNIQGVGNVSNAESSVILPEVGEHHNYSSDCAAAQGGVPLYGLYHNNGDLKIRISECPATTTTTTTVQQYEEIYYGGTSPAPYLSSSSACAGINTNSQAFHNNYGNTYPTGGSDLFDSDDPSLATELSLDSGWYGVATDSNVAPDFAMFVGANGYTVSGTSNC